MKREPASTEAWFYLAAAEYETRDLTLAEQHLHRVVSMNDQHSQAFYYLGLIAEANGNHSEALASVDTLNQLDAEKAAELTIAMKTLP